MSRYMLDTDTASYIIRGDHPEVIQAFKKNFNEVCISSITSAELQYGAMKRNNQQLTKKVMAFCNLVQTIEWNVEAASNYASLRVLLEALDIPIGSMDMLIAASALAEDAVLVTNNTVLFSKIKDLKLANWADNTSELNY